MNETKAEPFRVLLATDDSESARNAETWVSRARWPQPCVIDALTVASHGIARLGWPMQTDRSAVRQAVEQLRESEVIAAERVANEVAVRLQAAGHVTRSWTRQGEAWTHHGDVADEILATMDLEGQAVVVVGPRGRSTLAQLLLGSVSRRIITESKSPVLVARQPPPDGQRTLPRSLLVLVDGTPATEASVEWLISAGWIPGANVTLLGLLGVAPGVEDDDPALISQVNEALHDDAVTTLERLTQRLADQDREVDAMLEPGEPHETALRVAERLEPDAIVVARPSGRRSHDPFPEKVARYAQTSTFVIPEA